MSETMNTDIAKDKFLVDGFPRNEDNLTVSFLKYPFERFIV